MKDDWGFDTITIPNSQTNGTIKTVASGTLKGGNYRFIGTLSTTSGSNTASLIVNIGSQRDGADNSDATRPINVSLDFLNVSSGDAYSITIQGTSTTYWTRLENASLIGYIPGTSESQTFGKTDSVKQLGNLGVINIFGMNDGTFIGGKMLEKDTSATTGSVSLGNAVGYIKVNLNGEIVKIPYYGD